MKKLLAVVAVLACASVGYAAGDGNETGSDACGLGWQVTKKKTLIATTTRGSTNWVIPYTFGMTSGTMGCDQHSFAKKEQKAVEYVAANYQPLMIEMAEGRGEYLQAFAQTLGCKAGVQGHLTSTIQQNYSTIVDQSQNAVSLYRNVKAQMSQDPVLVSQCDVI